MIAQRREIQLPLLDRSYAELTKLERQKVWNALLPYVLYPEDRKKRRAIEAFRDAHLKREIDREVKQARRREPSKKLLALSKLLDSQYENLSWDLLLRRSVAQEMRQRVPKRLPGHSLSILYMARLLARLEKHLPTEKGGASLNKAIEIIVASAPARPRKKIAQQANTSSQLTGNPNSLPSTASASHAGSSPQVAPENDRGEKRKGALLSIPTSRASLEKIWHKYASVAHLHAALAYCSFDARRRGATLFDELDRYFGVALYFENFLSRFRVTQNGKHLVRPSKLWRLPSLKGVSAIAFELPTLTRAEDEVLSNYHAPKRF